MTTCLGTGNVSRIGFVLLVLGAILGRGAFAVEITYPDFSDTSSLTLNGSAATVTTADGVVLRLAIATTWQDGSAFSNIPLQAVTFSTSFVFRITNPGGTVFDCNVEPGADGIVFVVQSVSSSVGGTGGGIGYSGILDSVGVEFDTWCNTDLNDPSSNHLGIDTSGNVNHGVGAPDTVVVSPNFDNGGLWFAWIDYDGTTLEVRVSQTGTRPSSPVLARAIDIPSFLGGTNGYVGFTSATGLDWGDHDIVSWEYRDHYSPSVNLTLDASDLLWTSVTAGAAYDVVRGELGLLRTSGGNFTTAVDACLANDVASVAFPQGPAPAAGDGFWYLVRFVLPGSVGSYDSGGPGQAASRDPGIATSALACP